MASAWARNRWRTVATPAGEVPALLPPGVNSAFDYRMEAVPTVGQHNAACPTNYEANPWKAGRSSACP